MGEWCAYTDKHGRNTLDRLYRKWTMLDRLDAKNDRHCVNKMKTRGYTEEHGITRTMTMIIKIPDI
ncbi:hypothetical protein DPMN_140222 [Dreissena polymorpha]|uniref:Uncharacterized protein n=1 Tax=Dreissena polymorpha TaxID=45954 RepID=A0A9D4JLJ6_DREPO|nr:hypothetical protein DPMN_140222 [Dreissena polymorpha]